MKKFKFLALLFSVLFLMLSCDQAGHEIINDEDVNYEDVKNENANNEIDSPSNSSVSETSNESFHISNAYIKDNELYITASSTINEESIICYIALRVKDEDGNNLTTGPGGWMLNEQFTDGERINFSIKVVAPRTENILVEGIEKLNVNGITQNSLIQTNMKVENI